MATLDREIDRLYTVPLDEFTARRNELAKRLKKDGDADAADQVTALVKPSVPAWTINQLARRQKKEVQSLLATGARLRKAQEKALSGGGSDALLAAQAEERESVRDLTRRAAAILEEAGRPPTRAVLDRRQKAERERKRKQLEKRARDLADNAAAAEETAEQAEEQAADARELADDRRRAADLAADELAEFERSPT